MSAALRPETSRRRDCPDPQAYALHLGKVTLQPIRQKIFVHNLHWHTQSPARILQYWSKSAAVDLCLYCSTKLICNRVVIGSDVVAGLPRFAT